MELAVAALPLLLLFVMLGVLRVTAWVASLVSLALAVVIAILVYGMPLGQTLLAGTEGAAFGFFPILWIVDQRDLGLPNDCRDRAFRRLRRSFARVSDDQRVQAVIIAFSFGALLEALAGFGTPVAVTSVMLMALGFKPLKAAVAGADRQHRARRVRGDGHPDPDARQGDRLPSDTLGAMVGRQTPILALFVPLVLVVIVDGWRGVRETWPVALVCGVVFAVAQYATSNFISVPLADVVASLFRPPPWSRWCGSAGRAATGTRADRRRCRSTSRRQSSRSAWPTPTTGRGRARLRPVRDHHRGLRHLSDHRGQEAARQGYLQVPLAGAARSQTRRESRCR